MSETNVVSPTTEGSDVERIVMCDECDKPAEYIEHLPAFTARFPRYKCAEHKPSEPYEITYGVCMENKC